MLQLKKKKKCKNVRPRSIELSNNAKYRIRSDGLKYAYKYKPSEKIYVFNFILLYYTIYTF